jgi:hypothetical protein
MPRRLLLLGALTVAMTAIAVSSASAAITMTFPKTTLYVNSVPVGWATTSPPSKLEMVWTYKSGFYTITEPVVLTFASSNTISSGTFVFDPATVATNSNFSSVSGSLPDGEWSVYMKETVGGIVYSSSSVTVTTSTATVPPEFTAPAANTTTNTIPVSFTLPDAPSLADPVALSFTNIATSAVSTLMLGDTRVQSFTLNPSELASSSSVQSSTGPTSLTDGGYEVSLSYSDNEGHAAATTVNADWTLDRTTFAPGLTMPMGGSEESPLQISYSLPQTPLPGSVTLTFTGASTVTMTLADSTAGSHTLELDPLAPASSPDVTSVSPAGATLPDGIYDLTVAYQDELGNPASSAGQSGVAITAPAPPPASEPAPTEPNSTQSSTSQATTATTTAAAASAPSATSTAAPAPVLTGAIVPADQFSLRTPTVSPRDGAIALTLSLPGPGEVELLGTHVLPHSHSADVLRGRSDTSTSTLQPGWQRLAYGRGQASVSGSGHTQVSLMPNAAGRALIARERRLGRSLRIRLWVTFTPLGGQPRSREMTLTVLAGPKH